MVLSISFFGIIILSDILLEDKIIENSIKKDGAFYVSAQIASKEISNGRNTTSYYLKFNNLPRPDGSIRNMKISVDYKDYQNAIVGNHAVITVPLKLNKEYRIWNMNPHKEDIEKMKNGLYYNGKDSHESLKAIYTAPKDSNFIQDHPIISNLIAIAIIIGLSFVSCWGTDIMFLDTMTTIFYYFSNWDLKFISIGMMAIIVVTIVVGRTAEHRLKIALKNNGGLIKRGFLKISLGKKSVNYNITMWLNGKLEEFDISDPGIDTEGEIVCGIPFGIEQEPVLLSYDKDLCEKFKGGIYFRGGDFSNLAEIEDDAEMRRNIAKKIT